MGSSAGRGPGHGDAFTMRGFLEVAGRSATPQVATTAPRVWRGTWHSWRSCALQGDCEAEKGGDSCLRVGGDRCGCQSSAGGAARHPVCKKYTFVRCTLDVTACHPARTTYTMAHSFWKSAMPGGAWGYEHAVSCHRHLDCNHAEVVPRYQVPLARGPVQGVNVRPVRVLGPYPHHREAQNARVGRPLRDRWSKTCGRGSANVATERPQRADVGGLWNGRRRQIGRARVPESPNSLGRALSELPSPLALVSRWFCLTCFPVLASKYSIS